MHALHDGDEIEPWETVMTIEGDYSLFCHLETVYLGTLSRRTLIARNVREVVRAARGKPILYFPARHDHHRVQTGDGYAAHIAGAIGVSTDAQASWWGGRGMGTVPHGLIAAYGGDTVLAARRFVETLGAEMDVIVLVDFENDCVGTARRPSRARSARSSGACASTRRRRWSTARCRRRWAASIRAASIRSSCATCARRSTARASRACASSPRAASTWPRSRPSRRPRVPVDAYGVGSALIRGENDFTADVVVRDGHPAAKAGRGYLPNPRLERVDLSRAWPPVQVGRHSCRHRRGADGDDCDVRWATSSIRSGPSSSSGSRRCCSGSWCT